MPPGAGSGQLAWSAAWAATAGTIWVAETLFGPLGRLEANAVYLAASLLISVPVVIFYMWGQRFMVAGLTAGAVKE